MCIRDSVGVVAENFVPPKSECVDRSRPLRARAAAAAQTEGLLLEGESDIRPLAAGGGEVANRRGESIKRDENRFVAQVLICLLYTSRCV